jgi:hypothetical protein
MEFLEQLISAVEQDELEQPARDALLANLYAGLDGPGLDSYAGDFILAGIDMYGTVCGFAAVRGALLDYHLTEYEAHLEEGMRSPDRSFGISFEGDLGVGS